jgi:predicted MFS family arabinose efflux permease
MESNSPKLKRIFALIFPHTRLNHSLRILVATNSILVFIVGLFAPFYAVFIQHIGGNIAFAGLSWAIFSIVGGVLIFLFSNWELKVKEPELLLALGYILTAGVFLSYAFMTSITQLIVTQVLWGVATALGTPAFDSIYANHTTKENSIVEWGRWEGISAIVTGIAALIGGLLIQTFGYGVIFVMMAVISLGLGIYIWRLPREIL